MKLQHQSISLSGRFIYFLTMIEITFVITCDSLKNNTSSHGLSIVASDSLMSNQSNSTTDFVNFTSNQSIFVPENNWKEVLEGQVIPAGLHIRINLTSGKKEAKYMVEDDGIERKQIVYKDDVKENNDRVKMNESIDIKKLWLERKKRLGDSFKRSDAQHISELIELFANASSENELLKILEALQDYMHQIDNANDFVGVYFNGVEKVVLVAINSSYADVRSSGALLLGILSQNNIKAQKVLVEKNIITVLLNLLANDLDKKVQIKVLYAISCIVRGFPDAINVLVLEDGFTTLPSLILLPWQQDTSNRKLSLKSLSLLNDLSSEFSVLGILIDRYKWCHLPHEIAAVNEIQVLKSDDENFDAVFMETLGEMIRIAGSNCLDSDIFVYSLNIWLLWSRKCAEFLVSMVDQDKDILDYKISVLHNFDEIINRLYSAKTLNASSHIEL